MISTEFVVETAAAVAAASVPFEGETVRMAGWQMEAWAPP